jgi:hypothetical protein
VVACGFTQAAARDGPSIRQYFLPRQHALPERGVTDRLTDKLMDRQYDLEDSRTQNTVVESAVIESDKQPCIVRELSDSMSVRTAIESDKQPHSAQGADHLDKVASAASVVRPMGLSTVDLDTVDVQEQHRMFRNLAMQQTGDRQKGVLSGCGTRRHLGVGSKLRERKGRQQSIAEAFRRLA